MPTDDPPLRPPRRRLPELAFVLFSVAAFAALAVVGAILLNGLF
jgi:hypothetical protein